MVIDDDDDDYNMRQYNDSFVLLCYRLKRASDSVDDWQSTATALVGTYLSADLLSSSDTAVQPPNSPLHQSAVFPTTSGIDEQDASDLCRGKNTDAIPDQLYRECLNYAAADTSHYVASCVEDIKVTVCAICLFLIYRVET